MDALYRVLDSRNLITALFGFGFLGAVAFVLLYLRGSTGWWRSDVGRNLMLMMLVLAGVIGFVVAARAWGPFPRWMWATWVTLLDVTIWQRVIILWRKQHDHERIKK